MHDDIKGTKQYQKILLSSILFLYGAMLAVILCSYWYEKGDFYFMGSRVRYVERFIDYLLNGTIAPITDSNSPCYFYIAKIAVLTGNYSSAFWFTFIQLAGVGTVIALYPVLFYRITDSVLAGVLSPVVMYMVTHVHLWEVKTDSYWGMPWAVLMGMPLVILFCRTIVKKRQYWIILGLIAFVIGLSNVPRAHSGIGILAITTIIVLAKSIKTKDKLRNRLMTITGSFAIMIVGYVLFTSIVPNLYFLIKGTSNPISSFGPWHTVFLSYGWEENPYGIEWADEYGRLFAQNINPGIVYNSSEYMDLLKEQVFSMWKENPAWFIGSYVRKLAACVNHAFNPGRFNIWILLIFIATLVTGIIRNEENSRRVSAYLYLIILVIILFFTEMIFPMLAIPAGWYCLGMGGTIWEVKVIMLTYTVGYFALILKKFSKRWRIKKNG